MSWLWFPCSDINTVGVWADKSEVQIFTREHSMCSTWLVPLDLLVVLYLVVVVM